MRESRLRIDFDVVVSEARVFENNGTYNITLNSTGYNAPYSFEVKYEAQSTTTSAKTTTAAKTTKAGSNSPKTGVNGMALPMAMIVLAGATAFALRKKNY